MQLLGVPGKPILSALLHTGVTFPELCGKMIFKAKLTITFVTLTATRPSHA